MQHHRSDIGSIAALIVVRIVRRVIILRHTSLAVVHQRHMALACWRQKGPKAHIIEVILARLQHSGACRLWTTIWPEHESPRSKKQERPPVSWHGGFRQSYRKLSALVAPGAQPGRRTGIPTRISRNQPTATPRHSHQFCIEPVGF